MRLLTLVSILASLDSDQLIEDDAADDGIGDRGGIDHDHHASSRSDQCGYGCGWRDGLGSKVVAGGREVVAVAGVSVANVGRRQGDGVSAVSCLRPRFGWSWSVVVVSCAYSIY